MPQRSTADPRVLVTGGAGYIGSQTCKALRAAGFEPVTYDDLSTGHLDAVRWGPLEIGDVTDPQRLEDVLRRHRPVAVLHFAGRAYVGESVTDPQGYWHTNVTGSVTLLRALLATTPVPLVFSSTCATYGVPAQVPIAEDTPQQPINPYGRSKLVVEQAIADFGAAYGLPSVILRYFNAAGADPDGELGERHDPEPHLVPRLLDVAAGDLPSVSVYGTDFPTEDGSCVRDYVHVADLADAHVRAVEHLLRGGASVQLNLGTGTGTSVLAAARTVAAVTGREVPVTPDARRAGDPPALVADGGRARTVLGWQPTRSDFATIVRDAWAFRQAPPPPPASGARRPRVAVTDAVAEATTSGPRPVVSVVVPTHNRVRLLAQTLTSVLEQRDVELEVIVVDEASSDATPEVLARLDDPRVRVLRHERSQGLSAARNAGASLATGRWLAFTDDDDLWFPDKLASQLAAVEHDGADWAYGGALQFSDGPVLHGLMLPAPWAPDFAELPRRNVVPGGGSNVLVRRELLDTVGGFDPTIDMVADWDMWIRLAREGDPALVARPVVAYRLHSGNMSNGVDEVLRTAAVLQDRYAELRGDDPFDWEAMFTWLWLRAMRAGDHATARRVALASTRRGHPGAPGRLLRAGLPMRQRPPAETRVQVADGVMESLRPRRVLPWPEGAKPWLSALLAVGPDELLRGTRGSAPIRAPQTVS
ncbi:UDP-glucose 4-epimerase GalE [Egicoccus halophilus]|uniref:UDP-glucose 4-epimerase n=1 Tax=Egicoccus halophilus TaxID=1670830 RepID=A0A8J3A7A9_9ACTN|nr:UDP-glucose 4-epimerase GalE [Egicoccus halophilus]GGI05274.1 hypothetical protein GCM10011354_13280 [Egicoccus halophilus]